MTPERKRLLTRFWIAILVVFLIALLLWALIFRRRVYTDDAYVEGNQVFITPLQNGFVTAIHTDDTFLVRRGDLLVELDKTDATIAFESATNEFAKKVREVSQAFHDVFVYESELEVKKAELIKAVQDYWHRQGVLDAEGVSLEDFEHAVAALRAAYFSYKLTQTRYEKALSFVQGTSIRNHPVVTQSSDTLRQKWVDLYRCNIYSPVEGLAAQRTIQVGMWIKAGQPLLSIIPLDQIWVNANYKETQLKYMRIGQAVDITSDLYGRGVVYHGKVVGLPGGAGNAFSLLPPQNLSGNWIKIVQRLPVRVALDPEELISHPLRIGLSMEAWTYLNTEGELVPTSQKGSPCYGTTIFTREERGDCEWIEKIFKENLDPTLANFAEKPLEIEPAELPIQLPDNIVSLDLTLDSTLQLFSFLENQSG